MGLSNKLTVLVNSCDAYEDIWTPFFVLFDKYAGILKECHIVINTESKSFEFPGLKISTFSLFPSTNSIWGNRLKKTLEKIQTDYILTFMEDFFLVDNVNGQVIESVIDWMEMNPDIGAFHMIPLDCVDENSCDFPGFCEVKPGTPYRCNTQVCIWRKDVLYKSILDNETPWIWEDFGRIRNDKLMKSKVYSLSWKEKQPINYNFYIYGRKNEINRTYCHSGVIKGKWNMTVVKRLFRKNNIEIDFNSRGIYHQPIKDRIKCNKLLRIFIVKPYITIQKSIRKTRIDNTVNDIYKECIEKYVTPYLDYEKF